MRNIVQSKAGMFRSMEGLVRYVCGREEERGWSSGEGGKRRLKIWRSSGRGRRRV